jgi:CHASE2 domain-containing sensor protein
MTVCVYRKVMAQALVIVVAAVMAAFGVLFAAFTMRHRDEGQAVVAWGLSVAGFHLAFGATIVAGVWLPGVFWFAVGAMSLFLVVRVAARRRLLADQARAGH